MTDSAPLDATTAAERTSLAWQRTGLAMVAAGAVLVHVQGGAGVTRQLPGIVLLVTGIVAAALVAPLRYRRILRQVTTGHSPVGRAAVGGVCLAVGAAAVAAVVTVLLG